MDKPDPSGEVPSLPYLQRLLSYFLRWFFSLLYHQFAWTYDWIAAIISLGSWQEWVLLAVPYLPGPRILEIGFGRGHLLAALSNQDVSIIGLDKSHQMVRLASKKLCKAGFNPNLIHGDAFYLPFFDSSFNQIVLTFPAEFILSATSLQEIYRVLAHDGQVVIIPMAWITGQSLPERFVAWINRITGEAPEFNEKSLQPLGEYGFQVHWEIIPLNKSKVLIIKMVKSTNRDNTS